MTDDNEQTFTDHMAAVGAPVERGVGPLAEQCADLERRLRLAMRQWDHWKAYALELHDKLQRYEPGPSVMLLNASTPADPCPGCMRGGVCSVATCGRKRSSKLMGLYGTAA
jgi:hypothetical protein